MCDLLKRNIVIIGVLLVAAACIVATPDPTLKPSVDKVDASLALSQLQKTTIGMYDATPRGITKESADIIVSFTVNASSIIQSDKDGTWKQTVKASWTALTTEMKSRGFKVTPPLSDPWDKMNQLTVIW